MNQQATSAQEKQESIPTVSIQPVGKPEPLSVDNENVEGSAQPGTQVSESDRLSRSDNSTTKKGLND